MQRAINFDDPETSSEEGSIAPLLIGFFTMSMLLIFLIANVSATYIERRNLTNRVEESLALAAQELDEMRYYYGGPITEFLASGQIARGDLKVPIDCKKAQQVFRTSLQFNSASAVSTSTKAPGTPEIHRFECDGSQLRVVVSESFQLPFQLRAFKLNTFQNIVEAGITSQYR